MSGAARTQWDRLDGRGMPSSDSSSRTDESFSALRVLVVGVDPTLGKRVEQAMHLFGRGARIDSAPDALMALGYLGTSASPDVIVTRLGRDDDDLPEATDALRQLARDARIVALCDDEDEDVLRGAMPGAFDVLLVEPVDSMAIHRAITRDQPREAAGQTSPQTVSDAAPALGDIDLVELLLSNREGVRDMALRILESHSQLQGLAISEEPAAVPAGHASTDVGFGAEQFGVLHAPPPATEEQLVGWAGWLSRWLALEQRMRVVWEMALTDALTGAWNRRYFDRFLRHVLTRAKQERFAVTLLVFDIDDFKQYNDRYGHAAGDEILREASRLMKSVVREHDVVARIGGDEFGVIFWDAGRPRQPNSTHPNDVAKAAERFQRAIVNHRFPSGGLAGYPWDGQTAEDLLHNADAMALRSKRQGKNAITFGPGAIRNGCGQ